VQVVGFTLAPTFELSQTDGEQPFEVPTVQRIRRQRMSGAGTPHLLGGHDPTDAFDDIVKLIKDSGYSFELAPPGSHYLGTANGVTVGGDMRLVKVRDDVTPAQRLKTTVHELAHIRCDHLTGARVGEDLHRGRAETEAESVAHIVCKALGLDTADYSDAYVLGWADGDLDLVKQCAQTVLRVAKTILADLTPDSDDVGTGADELAEPTAEDLSADGSDRNRLTPGSATSCEPGPHEGASGHRLTVPGTGSRSFLIEPGRRDEQAVTAFTNGQCHALAFALHEATGYPLFLLMEPGCNLDPYCRPVFSDDRDGCCCEIIHVAVMTPDGRWLDISGAHPVVEFVAGWQQQHEMHDLWTCPATEQALAWIARSSLWQPPATDLARTFVAAILAVANVPNPPPGRQDRPQGPSRQPTDLTTPALTER
jgi:hypothetical protein